MASAVESYKEQKNIVANNFNYKIKPILFQQHLPFILSQILIILFVTHKVICLFFIFI